jgi:hypothetical protein
MKPNEDGFYSVEDCVAVLTKSPKIYTSKRHPRLDMRRRDSKELWAVLKGTAHVAHIPSYIPGKLGGKFDAAIFVSYEARRCLDCEDFDALITTLRTINRLTQ